MGVTREWRQSQRRQLAKRARRSPGVKNGLAATAIALAFGSLFLGIGLKIRADTQPYEDGITVEGVVVDAIRHKDRELNDYLAEVEFQNPESGETFSVVGSRGSKPTIGSTRTVSFPVGSPAEARIVESNNAQWILILLGVGAYLLALNYLVRTLVRVFSKISEPKTARSPNQLENHGDTPQDAPRNSMGDATADADGSHTWQVSPVEVVPDFDQVDLAMSRPTELLPAPLKAPAVQGLGLLMYRRSSRRPA